MEFSIPKMKTFLILNNPNLEKNFSYFFKKRACSEKVCYVLGNGTF